MAKLNKVVMVVKKVEYITVEISEDNGYTLPDGNDLGGMYDFLDDMKCNFTDYMDDELSQVSPPNITLESFKVL